MSANNGIGIFGGTFDPIHLGHLHLAQEVYQRLQLQEVRFIPAFQPVHRNPPDASANDRLQMVKLAIANHPGMLVDDREIRRGGPSYMIDTLVSLHQDMPNNTLYLIMATDAFAGFDSWHKWQEIINYAHLIIINRPENHSRFNTELKQFLKNHQTDNPKLLPTKPNGYIYFLAIPRLIISGTEIRQEIAAGKNPKKLLPEPVWEYIKKHNLYNYHKPY